MRAAQKMGPTEWALLIALSVVWGGAFFFYKVLDNAGLPPFTIVFGRVALAALVLLPAVLWIGGLPRSPKVWRDFLVLGALQNVIPFSLVVFGETQIASGLASIFNATTPLFTALVAHALTRDERLTPNKIAGIAVGLAGVIVLIGPGALHGINLASLAQLACIGAAVVYGFAAIFARRFWAMGLSPLATSTGTLLGSTAISLPLALFVEHPWTALQVLTPAAWWAWAGLAVPSTALAFIMYFRIMATSGGTNANLVTFLVPISALLLGTIVLGEALAPSTVAGMALIFAGLAAIDGRVVDALRSRL